MDLTESSDDEIHELIDGQQRVTTFFLIGHYINEMWRGKSKDPEVSIRYESRPRSAQFLKELCLDDDDKIAVDNSNIDFYHISQAYQTIADWVLSLIVFLVYFIPGSMDIIRKLMPSILGSIVE